MRGEQECFWCFERRTLVIVEVPVQSAQTEPGSGGGQEALAVIARAKQDGQINSILEARTLTAAEVDELESLPIHTFPPARATPPKAK